MIEYFSGIYSEVIAGTIGLTTGVFIRRIISIVAKIIVITSSLIVLFKFFKEHPMIFKSLIISIVILTSVFVLSSCSSNNDISYRINTKGEVINELRPLKGIFCEKELIEFRSKFNKFMTCADMYSVGFVSNIDSPNCHSMKAEVINSRKTYESCRLDHKADNIVSNPFNLIRDDI
jgi:hypothetical protein